MARMDNKGACVALFMCICIGVLTYFGIRFGHELDNLSKKFEQTRPKVSNLSATIVSNGVETVRESRYGEYGHIHPTITVKFDDGQIFRFHLESQKPSSLKGYKLVQGEKMKVKKLTKPGFPEYQAFEITPNT
jgi:hypothetical protein